MANKSQIIKLQFPEPHPAQQKMLDSKARYVVGACGRRFGKTLISRYMLATKAVAGGRVAYTAPTEKMMVNFWNDMLKNLEQVIVRTDVQKRMIYTMNEGIISFWSLEEPDRLRGNAYDLVVMDEAAYVQKAHTAWTAIEPTLLDRLGRAFIISTPNGLNWFYHSFRKGDPTFGGYSERWQSFHFPTTANPYILASEVDEIRKQNSEMAFRREYLAEFVSDDINVFRNIRTCATANPQQGFQYGNQYVMGVDLAKVDDFTVITIINATTREQVFVERTRSLDYTIQMNLIEAIYWRYNCTMAVIESNAMGQPIIDTLAARNINIFAFRTSSASKQVLVQELARAFDERSIRILHDDTLILELEAYTAEASNAVTGLIRYSAPEGMHDDMVMSLMLAWWGAVNESSVYIGVRNWLTGNDLDARLIGAGQ